MADPNPQAQPGAAGASAEVSEFESLLNKEFKPKTGERKSAVQTAVRTLAEQALGATKLVSGDAIKSIEAMIAEIDKKLSEQVNKILHHADFRTLEGSWRGLHHLVSNTETDEMLKIMVLNVSKQELTHTLMKFTGDAWDQSPIFKKIHEEPYGQLGGEPFGCLIG